MEFPDKLNKNLAEFIGILLGDGSISNTYQYRVQITLNENEIEYRKHVIKTIRELFNLEPRVFFRKGERAVDIQLFNQKLIDFMINDIGLVTAPKWQRAVIPSTYLNTDLEKDILRGYFDTDGSVVLAKNNGTLYPRLEMKISPSPMQKSFIEILERTGIRFGVYNIGRGKVRVQINGIKQIQKWMNQIGINNKNQSERLKKIAGEGFEPSTSGL
ncbi:MAG: hypothetical protein HYW23_04225 [Candidatus Aenigmarchaeota archaeon]|nr:hypothetical protein [Candidatus Aenigmarchaeota archaeon]